MSLQESDSEIYHVTDVGTQSKRNIIAHLLYNTLIARVLRVRFVCRNILLRLFCSF